jgi:3,4-dihydroxy 2-butanone 4-phosphate synthase/GTP cyclohydrolase II
VQAAVARDATPADLVQPGHIFPLQAQDGGVLMRAGHTEAGCDLSAMAGLSPAAVICEIMNDDGTMARLPDLEVFAQQHGLKIGTIADLIEYRSRNETLIERIGQRVLKTEYGDFDCTSFTDRTGGLHMALTRGQWTTRDEVLVRVHEPLSVMDLLDTGHCHHSWPLPRALTRLHASERGIAVLLNCGEGTPALLEKFKPQGNPGASRGLPMDLRTYGIGAQILRDMGVARMKLLGSPRRMPSMVGYGLEVTGFLAADASQSTD